MVNASYPPTHITPAPRRSCPYCPGTALSWERLPVLLSLLSVSCPQLCSAFSSCTAHWFPTGIQKDWNFRDWCSESYRKKSSQPTLLENSELVIKRDKMCLSCDLLVTFFFFFNLMEGPDLYLKSRPLLPHSRSPSSQTAILSFLCCPWSMTFIPATSCFHYVLLTGKDWIFLGSLLC